MNLGKTIRTRRCALGLNQKVLARASHLSIECIGKIERGEITNVGLETLKKIAQALEIDLLALIQAAQEDAASAKSQI